MKIIIAGDFAPKARVAKQIEERRFEEVFPKDLRDVIKSSDFSFVNFESPIVEDSYKPISKCGPNLCCTEEAAEAVKYAGFSGVTMANNHILDYGAEGLKKSVECCKKQGLDVVGVGNNLEDAEQILYIEKEGKTLAVINCCEHEFSIATATSAGANPLNPIQQYYKINEARHRADYVLIIVHGGHEHYQLPSPRMKETYRFFIDAGADAVVNHHQHCYSGYEKYNGKPIFYGVGNFCFDWEDKRDSIWNEGYLLMLSINDSTCDFELIPYIQCNEAPEVKLLNSKEDFYNKILELNAIIQNDMKLLAEQKAYMNETAKGYILTLEPYQNKYLRYLYRRGLLPSFLNKKKRLMLLNYLSCESHLERMINSIIYDS